jgi:adenylyltransferase/sulfurtransferase
VSAEVLVVGAGGIGAPAVIALVAAGVRDLAVVDDDAVETSNLHRQILFGEADVGRPKLEAFADALRAREPTVRVRLVADRVRPGSALAILEGAALVVDATDNFATRFLLADACALLGVPVVHAAAVRLVATVMAVPARGRPCYRCVFEDVPRGDAPDCATAGVLGPVCGVAGALAADAAVRLLAGDPSVVGRVVSFDGPRDLLRSAAVRPRAACPLCGEVRTITSLDPARYVAPSCAS